MRNEILSLLLFWIAGSCYAQDQAILRIEHQSNSPFYIEEIIFTKLNGQINSPSSTDIAEYTLRLDTGENEIALPVDADFCYYYLRYTVKNNKDEYVANHTPDVPQGKPFLLLSSDTLHFSYRVGAGRNPLLAYIDCQVSGRNAAFYRFQLGPDSTEDQANDLHRKLFSSDYHYTLSELGEHADNYVRTVEHTSGISASTWEIPPAVKAIVITDKIAIAAGSVHSMIYTYCTARARFTKAKIEELIESMDPLHYQDGFSDHTLAFSYHTSNTMYRYLAKKLNLRYWERHDADEKDAYYTADEMLCEIEQVGYPKLRSKLVWEWYVLTSYLSPINMADYGTRLTGLLYPPFDVVLNSTNDPMEYEFVDMAGQARGLSEFKGKVMILDWWFSGCTGCKIMAKEIRKVKKEFAQDRRVLFISVSIDKYEDWWKKSVLSEEYTSLDALNLYTGGLGRGHPMVADYNIIGYPKLIVIDKNGNTVKESVPDPRENFDQFVSFLKHYMEK